ncbi:MAG: carboxypeptidase-like regulatory domain-containing protein [Bacteroidales bacterium]|nr:carboxypeptidase-like regulatory domain-containing protein [Bacteroidales bacterium]
MKIFVTLLLNILLILFAQNNLKGIVFDKANHQPIPYATVYVNGTTNATYTDATGAFVLNLIPIPSQIVVSHLGYTPSVIDIEEKEHKDVRIELEAKFFVMQEVVVSKKMTEPNSSENLKNVTSVPITGGEMPF